LADKALTLATTLLPVGVFNDDVSDEV